MGAFLVRLTRSYDPWARAAWVDSRRAAVSKRMRLARFLAQHAGCEMDLDVEFERGRRVIGFRVAVESQCQRVYSSACRQEPRNTRTW